MTEDEKKFQFNIEPTNKEEIPAVLELIKSVPDALLEVDDEEISFWIDLGHSLVAKNSDGVIIGHQAAALWQQSGWVEVRAAVVKPEYRGNGINTEMKKAMIQKIKSEKPEVTIVGFTEAASKSRGILLKMGFKEMPLQETPSDFSSICPESCVMKTGKDCGCKIYTLSLASEAKDG